MKKRSVVLILFIFILITGVIANVGQKSVMLINSYNVGYHWTNEVSSGVEAFFSEYPEITLYAEFLDSKRFPDQQNWAVFLSYIHSKYANLALDAIIVSDNDALNFVLENRTEPIFENTPIIACGIGNADEYQQYNNLYIVVEEILFRYDVDLITKLLPDMNELFFITDHSTTGEIYRNDIKEIFSKKYPNIKLTVPDCFNLDELITQLKELRYPTVVYYAGVTVDCNNQAVGDNHVADLLAQYAEAPLFSGYYSSMVKNYIGGYTSNGMYHGRLAAKIVFDLFNGDIDEMALVQNVERVPVFDYLQLNKLGVRTDQLPANTIFLNMPESFWVKNKRVLIISTLIIINLLLIIGALYRSFRIEKRYRKSLQIEMEKASMSNQVKTVFLENVSHEMRTPLNSIVGFSDVLLEEMPEGQEKSFLRIISENALILNNIISQIFDFSLLKSHRVELNITSFELNELIDTIIKNEKFDVKLEQKNILFKKQLNSTDGKIHMHADYEKIYQVLKHIIGNAVKFTQKGSIEIMCNYSKNNNPDFNTIQLVNKPDRFVALGVFDSGIGISEGYFDQLFEPFSHDNEKDTNANRGLGLGLSISKLIIEIMGGRIKVESVANRGTKVVFTLPVSMKQ